MTVAKTIWNSVKDAENIVITAHKSPDGDSIGSSLALKHFLTKMGLNASVVHPDAAPEFLRWVPGQSEIIVFEENEKLAVELIQAANIIFCLDYNHPSRVGEQMQGALEKASAVKIMIDHHLDPADFCLYAISNPKTCSTAQLIYQFIEDIELLDVLDPLIGQCVYLGIMTDTGSFRFPSVESKTHHIIAHLISAGVNHSAIHEAIYDTNTIDKIRLKGYCMSEKLVCLPDLPIAYASMTADELLRFNAQKGDTEGLVNQILSIQGIKMAVFFAEKDGKIKISFRSKGEYVVNELAGAHFSGGGHAYASGGVSSDDMTTTIDRFVTNVKNFIPVS